MTNYHIIITPIKLQGLADLADDWGGGGTHISYGSIVTLTTSVISRVSCPIQILTIKSPTADQAVSVFLSNRRIDPKCPRPGPVKLHYLTIAQNPVVNPEFVNRTIRHILTIFSATNS